MIVRDGRDPRGRDEGPSSASVEGLFGGGVGASGFDHRGPMAQGMCPICGLKMNNGNQRTCIKRPADNSWQAMRKRGRGGYVFGAGMRASA